MTIKEVIINSLHQSLIESGASVDESSFTDELVLLQSGLDSMGFAILVAQLEDSFGYDPFVLMDEPVYPSTLGEFVSIYERFSDQRTS